MLHPATAPELFDRNLWLSASAARRDALVRAVEEHVAPAFRSAGLRTYAGTEEPVAVFVHAATGLEFSLIAGDSFEMGLSPEEERQIRAARAQVEGDPDEFTEEFDLLLSEIGQMRPLHRVLVPPFLMAQRVVPVGLVRRWLVGFRDPLYGDVDAAAAHLDAEQITALLVASGLRLPTEAELEYAARGGLARCLLPTGDRIPDENTLEAMIADTDGATHNALGIHGYGLYPELCADHWHAHYKGAPDDGSPWLGEGLRVIRGGAADNFPWQGGGEWNKLLCAFRMNDHAAEFGAALRWVRGLIELEAPAPTEPAETEVATKKKTAKKAATAKKTAKKTATAKKEPAAKKAPAKKAPAKKAPAKKAPAKKRAAKKA